MTKLANVAKLTATILTVLFTGQFAEVIGFTNKDVVVVTKSDKFYQRRTSVTRHTTSPYRAIADIQRWRADHQKNNQAEEKLFQILDWLDAPITKFPAEEVRVFLAEIEHAITSLESCIPKKSWTTSSNCDRWLSVRKELGHDVSDLRVGSYFLRLKAKYLICENHIDEGMDLIDVNFGLCFALSQVPDEVAIITGFDIATTTLNDLRGYIQLSEFPNLYWYLNALKTTDSGIMTLISKTDDFFSNRYGVLENWSFKVAGKSEIDLLKKLVIDDFHSYGMQQNQQSSEMSSMIMQSKITESRKLLKSLSFSSEFVSDMSDLQAVYLASQYELQVATSRLRGTMTGDFELKQLTTNQKQLLKAFTKLDAVVTGGLHSTLGSCPDIPRLEMLRSKLQFNQALAQAIERCRLLGKEPNGSTASSIIPPVIDPTTGKPFEINEVDDFTEIKSDLGEESGEQLVLKIKVR